MPLLSADPLFEEQSTRALAHAIHGGADFGECITTMQRVAPGDTEAWTREWTATADSGSRHRRRMPFPRPCASARAGRGCVPPITIARPAAFSMRHTGFGTARRPRSTAKRTAFAKAAAAFDPPLVPRRNPLRKHHASGLLLSRRRRNASAPRLHQRLRLDRARDVSRVRRRRPPARLALPAVRWAGTGPRVAEAASRHPTGLGERRAAGRSTTP